MLTSIALPDNLILFPLARALKNSLFRDLGSINKENYSCKEKIKRYTEVGKSYISRYNKLAI